MKITIVGPGYVGSVTGTSLAWPGNGDVDTYRTFAEEHGLDGRIVFSDDPLPQLAAVRVAGGVRHDLADSLLAASRSPSGNSWKALSSWCCHPVLRAYSGCRRSATADPSRRNSGDNTTPKAEATDLTTFRVQFTTGALSTCCDNSIEKYARRRTVQWQLAATRTPLATGGPGHLSAVGG